MNRHVHMIHTLILVNLAMAIAMQPSRPSVGILDLDVFGPSIPRVMGLTDAPEPEVNQCKSRPSPSVFQYYLIAKKPHSPTNLHQNLTFGGYS